MAPPHAATARLSAGLLLCACAGELDNADAFLQPACGDALVEVIVPSCGGCHSSQYPSGGLDVVSAGLPGRLVDQPASAACGGVLVPRSSPTSGFFMAKLLADPACGSRMPVGAAPLTDAQLGCVREWLNGVAAGP